MTKLRIGALAGLTGTNAPTIRYYEEIGLLRAADRQASGQRTYGEEDVKRLTFIRRCRDFGFSIEQVRALVDMAEDRGRPCADARELASQHLSAVKAKIVELKALETTLIGFVLSCDTTCAGGSSPGCVILDDIAKAPAERSGAARG